jgi:L-fucose mutarotase
MPLNGIPISFTPELLFAIAKMGHGDRIVIVDANFPADSIASHTTIKTPLRVNLGVTGTTSSLLKDMIGLMPLDVDDEAGICVMDRTDNDKAKSLQVPAYAAIATVASTTPEELNYIERFEFYDKAKSAFCIVQTDDAALYANVMVTKGMLKKNSRSKRKCWVVGTSSAPKQSSAPVIAP